MSTYISKSLKELVVKRAKNSCEYCQMSAKFTYFPFHIEHIVSLKHGGQSIESNLAYSCPICNLNKGSDIGTFVENPNVIIRFYNPRIDIWEDHFCVESNGLLTAKTLIGRGTIKILNFNHIDSVIERREMIRLGIFP